MIYDIVCGLAWYYYGFGTMIFLVLFDLFIYACKYAWLNRNDKPMMDLIIALLVFTFFLGKIHFFMYPVYSDIYHYFYPKPWYQVW